MPYVVATPPEAALPKLMDELEAVVVLAWAGDNPGASMSPVASAAATPTEAIRDFMAVPFKVLEVDHQNLAASSLGRRGHN